MTKQKMLEYAAKAMARVGYLEAGGVGVWAPEFFENNYTDLQVALCINLVFTDGGQTVVAGHPGNANHGPISCIEYSGDSRRAAANRAVLRVAAEIGRLTK